MYIVDSSVWIDFLRNDDDSLKQVLLGGKALCHPFIIAELALGSLKNRASILQLLTDLSSAKTCTHKEILALIESEPLFSRGIGYVDAHLIGSAKLTSGARLWTRDKRLKHVAIKCGINADIYG